MKKLPTLRKAQNILKIGQIILRPYPEDDFFVILRNGQDYTPTVPFYTMLWGVVI